MKVLLVLMLSSLTSVALASDQGSHASPAFGIQYTPSVSFFTGELGGGSGRLFHDIQLGFLFHRSSSGAFEAYLAVDVIRGSARHGGSSFPFPAGADLTLTGFLFVPTVCFFADSPVEACAGVGQGTLNVNSESDKRDYGTWNYQALVKYEWDPRWSVHILGKYIGQVEQTVNGAYSSFGLYTLGMGLGYRLGAD